MYLKIGRELEVVQVVYEFILHLVAVVVEEISQ